VSAHLGSDAFCFTYGDGLSDVDLHELISFHRREGALVTMTAVQPPGRFGSFNFEEGRDRVRSFREKPVGDGAWVNGGFFVVEPAALDYIEGDATFWEAEPMENLARDGQLAAWRHRGFWQCMDHLRDKIILEDLWSSGKPPWQVWKRT